MKLVIEGVLQRALPWTLVGIGIGIALLATAMRVPPLAFAVGVYLPVATMVPVFLGGLLRWVIERGASNADEAAKRREGGVLFGNRAPEIADRDARDPVPELLVHGQVQAQLLTDPIDVLIGREVTRDDRGRVARGKVQHAEHEDGDDGHDHGGREDPSQDE
jgi:hypothetical protein